VHVLDSVFPGLGELPVGSILVQAGSLDEIDRFIVEIKALEKFTLLFSSTGLEKLTSAGTLRRILFIEDDAGTFKLALRLAREDQVDAPFKRSRTAMRKLLRIARRYGLRDLEPILADRYAVLQNNVMPEIAAMLETNPRRRLYLFKSVVRKARTVDLLGGGTQSIQCKVAKLKIVANLLEACEHVSEAMTETWKRKYLRVAEKLLIEGRSVDSLPLSIVEQVQALQKRIVDIQASLIHSDDIVLQPPKLVRSISDSRRIQYERKAAQKYAEFVPYGTASLADGFFRINCGGQKVLHLHADEFQRFGIFQDATEGSFLLFDDPSRFELALYLVRREGRLDEAEKMDDTILKSYRDAALRYGLDWAITRRLDAWLNAHRHGAGGARNAREEVRALRLTRMLNPDKGEALVASALAEAYLERVTKENPGPNKRLRLLEKAETNLRVVLPVLLTSLSVVQVSKEQRLAIDQSVGVLKQILTMQGRGDEAKMLDQAVTLFSKGIQGAAKELSAATRNVPSGMYS